MISFDSYQLKTKFSPTNLTSKFENTQNLFPKQSRTQMSSKTTNSSAMNLTNETLFWVKRTKSCLNRSRCSKLISILSIKTIVRKCMMLMKRLLHLINFILNMSNCCMISKRYKDKRIIWRSNWKRLHQCSARLKRIDDMRFMKSRSWEKKDQFC